MLAISGLMSGHTQATEFYDQAEVVRFEPITRIERTRQAIPGCLTKKPETTQLMELLQWDLGTVNCVKTTTEETITGYQVFYRWDNQLFSQVTQELPGQTIPVHIRIDGS